MNGIRFSTEQLDPIITATNNSAFDDPKEGFRQPFEDPVSVIACTHQIQVCKFTEKLVWNLQNVTLDQILGLEEQPAVPGPCTAFDSIAAFQKLDNYEPVLQLDLTERQKSILQSYIMTASQWYSMGQLAQLRQDRLLLAIDKVSAAGLPVLGICIGSKRSNILSGSGGMEPSTNLSFTPKGRMGSCFGKLLSPI